MSLEWKQKEFFDSQKKYSQSQLKNPTYSKQQISEILDLNQGIFPGGADLEGSLEILILKEKLEEFRKKRNKVKEPMTKIAMNELLRMKFNRGFKQQ